MKKLISVISAIIMSVSIVPTIVMAEDNDSVYENYDFNLDGLVNGEDVYLLTQRYMEIGSDIVIIDQSLREKIDSNGDLNADNLINMADARLLMDYISENNIVGDVNCDGVLDSRDASDILSYYVNDKDGQSTSIDYGVIALGDYDRNGVVDARDASAVLTYYVTSDNK